MEKMSKDERLPIKYAKPGLYPLIDSVSRGYNCNEGSSAADECRSGAIASQWCGAGSSYQ